MKFLKKNKKKRNLQEEMHHPSKIKTSFADTYSCGQSSRF
jgi:hypothetical protein